MLIRTPGIIFLEWFLARFGRNQCSFFHVDAIQFAVDNWFISKDSDSSNWIDDMTPGYDDQHMMNKIQDKNNREFLIFCKISVLTICAVGFV